MLGTAKVIVTGGRADRKDCSAGCFSCGMGYNCERYRQLQEEYRRCEEIAMNGLTAKEVLNELKSRFNMELAPTEQTALNKLRDWVRRGIIDGPLIRAGVGGTGGRQGLYSKELPTHLAITLYLKDNYTNSAISLKDLSKARQLANSIKNNTKDNPYSKENLSLAVKKYGDSPMLDMKIIAQYYSIWNYSLIWLLYEAKARMGIDFKIPMKININIKITEDSYEYSDGLEPNEEDDWEFTIDTKLNLSVFNGETWITVE